ncbi:hypothetical protein CJ030_MR1G028917 [Morella rubra]|uniref:Uncharacterized protein n=1 Tax=Morella rubra TaxID=262757 RepID=A0A6A1WYV3_9ROSI|nr:hypothetical protein CJ030_MR1G028917 [Morella rubra]
MADRAYEVDVDMVASGIVAEEAELSAILKVSADTRRADKMEAINIFIGFLAIVMVLLGNNVDYICGGCNTQRCRVPNSSGPTMCSVAAGQGAPSINGIPDAMMSATESPGVDGTLPVSVVNRPIRSSLEAGQGPLRIDETSTALSPTRRTPEDPEAGEVPARGPPTSPDVDFIEFLLGNNVDYICGGCNTQRCRVPESTKWEKIWVEA